MTGQERTPDAKVQLRALEDDSGAGVNAMPDGSCSDCMGLGGPAIDWDRWGTPIEWEKCPRCLDERWEPGQKQIEQRRATLREELKQQEMEKR